MFLKFITSLFYTVHTCNAIIQLNERFVLREGEREGGGIKSEGEGISREKEREMKRRKDRRCRAKKKRRSL